MQETLDKRKDYEKAISFGDKNPKIKNILKVIGFIFIIFSIIIGSFFSVYYSKADTYNINYKGGYGLNVIASYDDANNNNDNSSQQVISRQDATKYLKDKLDPLNNKNMQFKSWYLGDPTPTSTIVNVEASKGLYNDNILNFINDATQPGYLYFTDENVTKDLLISSGSSANSNTRITTDSLISSVSASVNKNDQNKPVINFSVKDTSSWNTNVLGISQSQSGSSSQPQPFIIWTDLGNFLNDLRNITNYNQFAELYSKINAQMSGNATPAEKEAIHNFFNYNNGTSNLYDQFSEYSTNNRKILQSLLNQQKNWSIGLAQLNKGMDANSSTATSSDISYIQAFYPMLKSILTDKTINNNHQFDKYQLANVQNPTQLSGNLYTVSMVSESNAKNTASLINSSIHGIIFNVTSSYNINPTISSVQFKISVLLFISFILGIIILLSTYYRLFGLICGIGILFTLSLSYLFIGILSIQIGPPLILAALIILFLNIDSNISFFEHFRKEYYKQNVSNTKSYKLATKKTFSSIIDYHLLLLFLGLAIFIFSTGSLRMFSISIIVLTLISFIIYFFIIKILYHFVIMNKWLDKNEILRMPKTIEFSRLKVPSNKSKIKANSNSLVENTKVIEKKTNNKNSKFTNLSLLKKNKFNAIIVSLMLVIVIISSTMFGIYGTRYGQETIHGDSSNSGSIFLLKVNSSTDETSLENDRNIIDKAIKNKYHNKFDYTIYVLNDDYSYPSDNNQYVYQLMITTSISYDSKDDFVNQFKTWLTQSFNNNSINISASDSDYHRIVSSSYTIMMKQLMIILGVMILVVLMYILIRFNWAQFIGVLGSLLCVMLITVFLVNISHIWITLEMILGLLGVAIYVLIDGLILCNKIKTEKLKHNIENYSLIFNKFNTYKKSKSEYNKFFRSEFKIRYKNLILSNVELSNEEFKNRKNDIKNDIKIELKNKKSDLISAKKDYQSYIRDNEINYLFSIKKTVIKDSFKRAVITSLSFSTIILLLMFLGGMSLGFSIVILIGINLAIFSSLFTLMIIWLILDKFNLINTLKINKFFKNYNLDLDEEDIKGINI